MSVIGIANWGPSVIATDIDDAALGHLKTWMPTYLRRARTERNLPFTLALPRAYGHVFAGQEFLDQQLPAIVVVAARSTAMRGGAIRDYEATWSLEIATVLRGKTPRSTKFLAALYEGTTARLMGQQACGEPLSSVHYTGMRFEQVPDVTKQGRWLLAGVSVFDVRTDRIFSPTAGPSVPDADVYLEEATVVEVDIEVDGMPMTGGSFT